MKGLTSAEVSQRKKDGKVNNVVVKTSRSYADIAIKNIVTPFNIILFVLGAALLLLGNLLSAISATGIIIVNIFISTIQEMRAKHRLDKISLLTRPKVTVVRDGEEVEIDQSEIVQDDLIIIHAGEQALVDGTIQECRSLEMDESLLTGESSTVRKNPGDKIYSGSFCVTGQGEFIVTAFGNDSYASQMLSSAKKFTSKKTPLQMETTTITTALMTISFVLLFFSVIVSVIRGANLFDSAGIEDVLEIFVICLDIVPIALFLLITITYMLTAIRMANTGVLLQRFNSVESISHVEIVCMDKTGTITTNNLLFESAEHLIEQNEAENIIRYFVSSTGSVNKTMKALADRYGKTDVELLDEIQFSSARKYSAVKIKADNKVYTLYSGAWTVIREYCSDTEKIDEIIERESSKGFRTLVLCESEDLPLAVDGEFKINPLKPVTVISIRDEVRPDCRETIEVFLQNNMDIKVISGDDPVTVDALFKIADIPGERNIISGPELEKIPDSELDEVVLKTNIFGRMKPENKEKVIEVLKRNSKYVAMIGDGVNDVKSIKSAQVGIALQSGSGAARGVADMVLIDDNFSALPKALVEGRRTISGIRDILKVYISRNLALAFMFILMFFILARIPMLPIQNTFYSFTAVGVIAFFMTIFASPDKNDELILPRVISFSLPSAIVIGVMGVIVYIAAYHMVPDIIHIDRAFYDYLEPLAELLGVSIDDVITNNLATSAEPYTPGNISVIQDIVGRTCMVLFASVTGAIQLLIVCPYFKFLSVDGNVNKRKLPIILVCLILLLIAAAFTFVPWLLGILGMSLLDPVGFMFVAIMSIIAFFVILFVVKKDLMRRPVDIFQKWYLKRLDKEYTKGDVVVEEGLNIKDDIIRR
ncbi:MAG: HAD-IC family P-type ATPase [Candidatus Methanomethylophilaceae archaeon]|nr:HAD-IC family P-type ATPase [Candidatus Methanomethylophilaceae archaeon]